MKKKSIILVSFDAFPEQTSCFDAENPSSVPGDGLYPDELRGYFTTHPATSQIGCIGRSSFFEGGEASPSQLEQLSEKLKDASAKLPVDFDGMDRIGEISGHLDSKVWDQILDSKDGLATRNPELAERPKILSGKYVREVFLLITFIIERM